MYTYANGTAALKMPSSYVPMTEEEMTYVDGGAWKIGTFVQNMTTLYNWWSYLGLNRTVIAGMWAWTKATAIGKLGVKLVKVGGMTAGFYGVCAGLIAATAIVVALGTYSIKGPDGY